MRWLLSPTTMLSVPANFVLGCSVWQLIWSYVAVVIVSSNWWSMHPHSNRIYYPLYKCVCTCACSQLPSPSSSEPDSTVAPADTNSGQQKQQELQLRELGTEARLLLIDRSIKSSLTQGHEDIPACIDRLEVLNRLTLSLPLLAKCWIIVETIRKVSSFSIVGWLVVVGV